uniref:Uncharacterized protein n=2 Tax=Musa acuminata subsp. malaccensis TaxID=214687 RepID=A0A804HYP6_MUSAM
MNNRDSFHAHRISRPMRWSTKTEWALYFSSVNETKNWILKASSYYISEYKFRAIQKCYLNWWHSKGSLIPTSHQS